MGEVRDLTRVVVEDEAVDRAVRQAARAARAEYIRFGHAMPVWRDGRLAWVSAAELAQLDDLDAVDAGSDAGASSISAAG
jgi:hypothetical protein